MNSIPLPYRLLLVALIPLIAAVLFLRGQQYDPALIDFRAAGQEKPSTAAALQPAKEPAGPSSQSVVAGFRQLGRTRNYTKENLYEHVDGHAEYFIGAGFKGLTVTEYVSAGSKAEEAEIQCEVYDMGKGIQAFGVLADESGENPPPVSVGAMGFKTSGGVNFIKGRYYVKISARDPKTQVGGFARVFAETLPSEKDSFGAFARLPDMGKVNATRFVKEGYRGLDFLHNVVEREYQVSGRKVAVALITGNEQEIRAVMTSFVEYFKKSGTPYEKAQQGGREVYKVVDKYEGTWFLILSPDAVFGVFGTDDEGVLKFFATGKGRKTSG